MSASDFEGLGSNNGSSPAGSEFDDISITCIDCSQPFIWTIGEQVFFRDKKLQNSPKRCKGCKHAKNRRLEAIEVGQVTGKRQRFEVKAKCARCNEMTTVPFYPSQGRPVYCRACFIEMKTPTATGGAL
jgi:CxxC-x17-CxxC domain-containing protein